MAGRMLKSEGRGKCLLRGVQIGGYLVEWGIGLVIRVRSSTNTFMRAAKCVSRNGYWVPVLWMWMLVRGISPMPCICVSCKANAALRAPSMVHLITLIMEVQLFSHHVIKGGRLDRRASYHSLDQRRWRGRMKSIRPYLILSLSQHLAISRHRLRHLQHVFHLWAIKEWMILLM